MNFRASETEATSSESYTLIIVSHASYAENIAGDVSNTGIVVLCTKEHKPRGQGGSSSLQITSASSPKIDFQTRETLLSTWVTLDHSSREFLRKWVRHPSFRLKYRQAPIRLTRFFDSRGHPLTRPFGHEDRRLLLSL